MARTTDFTNFSTEHPNYFPGQYLLEDDFELQHKYLSDRQRYYNHSLHISGIIEGLEVEPIQNQKTVRIKSGSAINNQGELIVLKADLDFSDFKDITNGELYIQYSEEKQVKQQEDVPESYTRWIENPLVGFADTTPDRGVKLATLTISESTITIDANIREYSGLSLPNSNGKALTLRSGGNANPNLAVLTASLEIDGDLTVNGTISGNIDAQKITSGVLAVERIPNLSADKITSEVLAVERIPDLSANKITSGVLAVERIPDLSANKITSGTINGNISIDGNITGENLSLALVNAQRGALFLATDGDYNHALYNNFSNIDNEGGWDGVKWNVYNGLNIRVGRGSSKNTALLIDNNGIRSRNGILVNGSREHINVDGAFYRHTDGQVYITVDDNFYIRDTSSGQRIHINTNNGHVTCVRLNETSDANLKKEIQPVENGLQKILSLRGVSFQWKEDKSSQQADRQLGLIAQDVETIFPEIVQIGHDGMRTMNYTGLIAPMIEAIKEQQKQISSLLMRLEEQQSQIEKLNS